MKFLLLTLMLAVSSAIAAEEASVTNDVVATMGSNAITRAELSPSSDELRKHQVGSADGDASDWTLQYQVAMLIAQIKKPLLEEYMKSNGLKATAAELALYQKRMSSFLMSHSVSTNIFSFAEEWYLSESRDAMIHLTFESSRLADSLFRRYGGGVSVSKFGCVATDAQVAFLKQKEREGVFTIMDSTYEKLFWERLLDTGWAEKTLSGSQAKAMFERLKALRQNDSTGADKERPSRSFFE